MSYWNAGQRFRHNAEVSACFGADPRAVLLKITRFANNREWRKSHATCIFDKKKVSDFGDNNKKVGSVYLGTCARNDFIYVVFERDKIRKFVVIVDVIDFRITSQLSESLKVCRIQETRRNFGDFTLNIRYGNHTRWKLN